MAKIFIIFISIFHGLIHLMGFAKAFKYAEIKELTLPISKPAGLVWLVSALLFVVAAVLLWSNKEWWWMVAVVGIVLSQSLIVMYWRDAKFGTIANVIILLAVILAFGSWQFHRTFKNDVKTGLARTAAIPSTELTETDIQHLPGMVQKYLRYVGVVNQKKVNHVFFSFKGQMRDVGKDWFDFDSEQYNFFDVPTRLFFMRAKIKGLPVTGLHAYRNGKAVMLIKLLALFPVVDIKGPVLDTAETVTVFNDMCILAPATLIDKRIQWEPLDSLSVKATFTHNGIGIQAVIYFNEVGQLVNFVSDDRLYTAPDKTLKRFRWSTPMSQYKEINGFKLPTYGEAIWHFPEGDFCYGKFFLQQIQYNRP